MMFLSDECGDGIYTTVVKYGSTAVRGQIPGCYEDSVEVTYIVAFLLANGIPNASTERCINMLHTVPSMSLARVFAALR